MSKNTKIQWCDSTVNPTMGCDGCELWKRGKIEICYAGKLHERRLGHKGFAPSFEQVTMFPGRMSDAARWHDLTTKPRFDKPWLHDLPRLIFVSDMSDCLSEAVSFEYLRDEIIDAVTSNAGEVHHWLWLTKRPGRMAQFSAWLAQQSIAWPENLWAGTSVTTQATISRIDQLANVGDKKTLKFASIEPQWSPVTLGKRIQCLNWVIHGGESGCIDHPFDMAWAHDIQAECRVARVPYFLKQLGANVVQEGQRLKFRDKMGGDWSEWPDGLAVRQMPIYVGHRPRDGVVRRNGESGRTRWTRKSFEDCY